MRPRLGAVVAGALVLVACGRQDAAHEVVGDTVVAVPGSTSVDSTIATTSVDSAVASTIDSILVPATLADCADVAPIATDVPGILGPVPNPDPLFLGVVATYAEEHADVSGGYWIDRESGGTVVLAVTDEPAAHLAELGSRSPQPTDVAMMEPRPEVVDTRPLAERDETFDVLQVAFTEAEMNAAVPAMMAALQAAGIDEVGAGASFMLNRVTVFGSDITATELPELAAALADVAPLDMVCVEGVVDELPQAVEPGTALEAIVLPDTDGSYPPGTLVECGGIGFTLGELQTMRPLATAGLDGLAEAVAATIESLGGGDLIDVSRANVLQDDGSIVNVVSFTDTGMDAQGWFKRTPTGGWTFEGGGTGAACDIRLQTPAGTTRVDWTLDPAYAAPVATDTDLHVLIRELSCGGDRELADWLLGPEIVVTPDAVRIAFAETLPESTGVAVECSGSDSAASVTVTLPEPLGERPVVDGLVLGPPSAFM